MKSLYKLEIRIVNVFPSIGHSQLQYVVADDPTSAWEIVKDYYDRNKGWSFPDIILRSIEVICVVPSSDASDLSNTYLFM